MQLPADLQELVEAMNAADAAADALASRVTDDELVWRPDEGRRWSIALCLDHLAVTNRIYGAAIDEAVKRAQQRGLRRRGPAVPGFFGRTFVASLEPPVKRRTSGPAKIQPRPAASRDEILRAYHQAHDEIRRIIADAASIDVNRATFPNPFFSMVSVKVSTGLNVVAAHDRRHLWQASAVEKELPSRRKG